MRNISNRLVVEPYSQWEAGVASPSSACGPATMAALVEYWNTRQQQSFIHGQSHFHSKAAHINYIYSNHGGTPWGMSVKGFMKGLKAYIRSSPAPGDNGDRRLLLSSFNDFKRYKEEIDAGRPVAVKFDKWFSFRWKEGYAYDYHWVIGTGYEQAADGGGETLIILDNGVRTPDGSYTPSKERRIDYSLNKDILTMVSMNIEETSGSR